MNRRLFVMARAMLAMSTASLACLVSPILAQPAPTMVPQLQTQGAGRAPWDTDLRTAYLRRHSKDFESAADAFARVLETMARVEPEADTLPGLILPMYGEVLLELRRFDEAEKVLLRALDTEAIAERAYQAIGESSSRLEMMRALEAATWMMRDVARQIGQSILVEGEEGDPRGSVLALQIPEAKQPSVLLAEVYARRGAVDDTERMARLYDGPFQQFLARATNPPPESQAREHLLMVAEVASWRMGILLAGAGSKARADEAFEKALDFNLQRLRFYGTRHPLVDFQLAGFNHRRMIASALATHVLAGDRSETDARLLVAAIASSKGLVSRYAGARRSLLAKRWDMRLMQARHHIEELERDLRHLPTTGPEAIHGWVGWVNAYANALAPALGALEDAGLGEVFIDGRESLERVQGVIGKGAVLGFSIYSPLNFASTTQERARYLRYTIDRAGVFVQDVGDRRDIDRLVRAWRGDIDKLDPAEAGTTLAEKLFAGMTDEAASADEWVVDPDGLLALLPFEALPLDSGLVLDRRSVRYISSLARLSENPDPRASTAPGKQALVLADPLYGAPEQMAAAVGTLVLRTGSDARIAGQQLQALPDTRSEAEAVVGALNKVGVAATLLLGEAATPGALREHPAPRFLHIASHAILLTPDIDRHDPRPYRTALVLPGMLAGLALTPDANGPMLWATDLAQLDLRGTELVVLSACDTGNGMVDVGEGLTSLRRAAEEAGARATLTSLWPVSSGQTAALMSDFYTELASVQSKSNALRAAKLKARARGASVRDWAGFLLAGNEG